MKRTDRYRADLIALVDRYKLISGKADSSVSIGAFPTDFNFVSRIRDGKNFTIYKAAKLEDYIEQRFEDIRRQLAARPDGLPVSKEESVSIRETASQPPASDRSKEGGVLSDDDGNEYRHRGFASPHGV